MIDFKIAYFGGAFDPPTPSHVESAEILSANFDVVMIMPCFKSLFGKQMTDYRHRIEMCKLSVQHLHNVCVTDIESQVIGLGSLQILDHIVRSHSMDSVYFVLGGDNVEKMDTWPHFQQLITHYQFFILPRAGYAMPEEDMWYKHSPHVISSRRPRAGSSTEIRALRQKGMALPSDFKPEVIAYMNEHRLYEVIP